MNFATPASAPIEQLSPSSYETLAACRLVFAFRQQVEPAPSASAYRPHVSARYATPFLTKLFGTRRSAARSGGQEWNRYGQLLSRPKSRARPLQALTILHAGGRATS